MHKMKFQRLMSLLLALMMLASTLLSVGFAEMGAEPQTVEVIETVADEQMVDEVVDAVDSETVTDEEKAESAEQHIEADSTVDEVDDSAPLPTEETPVDENSENKVPADSVEDGETEPMEEPHPIEAAIAAASHAYVWAQADIVNDSLTIPQGAVLLATSYDAGMVKVWFINDSNEVVNGFVETDFLSVMSDEEANALAETMLCAVIATETGDWLAFVMADQHEETPDEPVQDEVIIQTESPAAEDDLPIPSETPTIHEENQPTEEVIQEMPSVQIGDFVLVTTETRVFVSPDESQFDGCFVNESTVQIESVEQDAMGNLWYRVCYLYGDDFADGTLKWTEYGTIYVLAAETFESAEQFFTTITDFAFKEKPAAMLRRAARANSYYPLRHLNDPVSAFYVGQSGLYGDSGKDSDYLQIAKDPDHGTIYATPHYLEGYTVYCLEHTLPGPGERISGGGYQPTGPYTIVDINTYRSTPSYSGTIYSERTLHAIAWVLRHTYPFMVLDRDDYDNNVWSRVAGQFAIRQVIRELEGAQYVRDYWNMDNFYVGSGQAPEEYLDYARWLADGGIARANMTGKINVSNKSSSMNSGILTGTVTLHTDADMMRIPKSNGHVTGHTAGEDASYYYLYSGDTISASTNGTTLTINVESLSSPDEEANFLIGVTDAPIQQVLIPIIGSPTPLDKMKITFDVPLGGIVVLKENNQGMPLAGAIFELLDSAGNRLQTQTTDGNGMITFSGLTAGIYTVREINAPTGYLVGVTASQNVSVNAGQTAQVLFRNDPVMGKIRIMKRDQLTQQALAGATFTITRLSAPPADNNAGVGTVAATITTGADGIAETDWLPWGKYRVEETGVPANYVDNGFVTEVEITAHQQTYTVDVENEPMKGHIRLLKENEQGMPLVGTTFDLLDSAGNVLQTQTTDENGVILFSDLVAGTYTVRETSAPTGYLVDVTAEQTVTVEYAATSQVTFQNAPVLGKIRIVKRDQLTQKALAGATFTITRLSAPPADNGAGVGSVAAVITTGADGIAETDWLPWGKYRVEETGVPAHYVDNGFVVEVEVTDHQQTYTLEVENEPMKGFIQLLKTDRATGNPIKGMRFDIYQNDQLVSSMVTEQDGIALSEPLTMGQYVVREHGATAGYLLEEIVLETKVKPDETTHLTATNQPVMVKLKLYKRDTEEYAGDPATVPSMCGDGTLIGAEFQIKAAADIKDRQGNVLHAKGDIIIPTLKTAGEDASITTPELWPGLYEVIELTPPKGYQPSKKAIRVDARDAAKQSQEAVITYEGVVENKIAYGAFSIVKFLGDNQEHVGSGIVEEPEQGAEFEVYLKRAGSYGAVRECERDYLKTNRYGKDKTKALPYGVYVLKQVVGKDGHALMEPLEIMIDGTEDLSDPPSLILNNHAISYRMRIVKKDAETGGTVACAGVSFQLRDADGNLVTQSVTYPTPMEIDTFTTDANGEVALPQTVPWGHYFITEVTAPDGYLLNEQEVSVFVGHTGDDPEQVSEVVAEVFNTPVKGRIFLEKKGLHFVGFKPEKDAYGNEVHKPVYENSYLAGVTFDIYAAENIIGKDGTLWYAANTLVETLTTTEDAPVQSKELPLGKYVLYETSAPAGYLMDTTPHEIELTYADAHTPVVEVRLELTNDYLPAEITLTKHKEELQRKADGDTIRQTVGVVPGEGFVFGLFNDDDLLVATGATDANGKLTFSGNYPHGAYSIRELFAPDGWNMSAERFDITLDPASADKLIRVELPAPILNELIYSKITLTKTDITGAKTIPGAQIEVRNEQGQVIYRATTDSSGQIPDIPVVPGKYTFRETLAPSGYALNTAEMSFTVHADGSVTGDTVIRDDYTRFTLKKQDTQGYPLAGVVFSLVTENGVEIIQAVSTEIGLVTFEKIPYGRYTVQEKQPLEGYIKSPIAVDLKVDGTYINPAEPVMIVNIPNHYSFRKVDEEGNPLTGVKFVLEDANENVVCELISGEDGMVHVTELALGSYTIRETEALEGYIRSEDVIELVIDESYVVSDELLYMVNHAGIQTGVDIEMMPMMWGGAALMVVGSIGLLVYSKKRRLIIRKK